MDEVSGLEHEVRLLCQDQRDQFPMNLVSVAGIAVDDESEGCFGGMRRIGPAARHGEEAQQADKTEKARCLGDSAGTEEILPGEHLVFSLKKVIWSQTKCTRFFGSASALPAL